MGHKELCKQRARGVSVCKWLAGVDTNGSRDQPRVGHEDDFDGLIRVTFTSSSSVQRGDYRESGSSKRNSVPDGTARDDCELRSSRARGGSPWR